MGKTARRHTDKGKYKYKVVPRLNVCYICQKQGVQGFKILSWLSSCDDTDKDKHPILCMFRGEYFLGGNIFRSGGYFRGECFSGMNIFQGRLVFMDEYFSGINIFQGGLVFRVFMET